MKINEKFFPFILVFLWFSINPSGVFASGGIEEEVTVRPNRQIVNSWEGPWPAYIIAYDDGRELHWIWGIKGFSEYSDGTAYRIKLTKKKISNPPVDSPDTEYILTEIISRKKVALVKDLRIQLSGIEGPFLRINNNNEWHLAWEIPVNLSPSLVPETLVPALCGSREAFGIFDLKNGKYILKSLDYEFLPDIFLDRLISVTGEEPGTDTVTSILNARPEEIASEFPAETELLFEQFIRIKD